MEGWFRACPTLILGVGLVVQISRLLVVVVLFMWGRLVCNSYPASVAIQLGRGKSPPNIVLDLGKLCTP